MRALLFREGAEPEVIGLRSCAFRDVLPVLGSRTLHGHGLRLRSSSGSLLLALYPGPGHLSYAALPIVPGMTVLIVPAGPTDDGLSAEDIVRICAQLVTHERSTT